MIYPKFINKNDTIYLVAPSFGCTFEPYFTRLSEGINYLKQQKYQITEGPNIRSYLKGASNTALERAKEIYEAFNSLSTFVISVGGGELMCEILDHLDFNIIKNNPKWFMGFSDNTHLTFLITILCDMATVYGPCATQFGLSPLDKSAIDALDLIEGKKGEIIGYKKWQKDSVDDPLNPTAPLNLTEETILVNYPNKPLEFEGRLIGGCLDVLMGIVGTNFDKVQSFLEKYQEDGFIWFLEACDMNIIDIKRSLLQLKRAQWFKYAKGFIIGRPLLAMGEEMFETNHYDAVNDVLKDLNLPCIFDIDLGHLSPTMPIITGSLAKVSSINNDFKIEYIFQ